MRFFSAFAKEFYNVSISDEKRYGVFDSSEIIDLCKLFPVQSFRTDWHSKKYKIYLIISSYYYTYCLWNRLKIELSSIFYEYNLKVNLILKEFYFIRAPKLITFYILYGIREVIFADNNPKVI